VDATDDETGRAGDGDEDEDRDGGGSEFASLAGQRRASFLTELWHFARQNARWWMTPIVVILLLLGLLVLAGGSGAGPLLYPLF
jgi:hypothetical protein